MIGQFKMNFNESGLEPKQSGLSKSHHANPKVPSKADWVLSYFSDSALYDSRSTHSDCLLP